jgi:hypothetical protein
MMMIPAILEKMSYVAGVAVLSGKGRISAAEAASAGPDLLLGVLFIVAYATTSKFTVTGSLRSP